MNRPFIVMFASLGAIVALFILLAESGSSRPGAAEDSDSKAPLMMYCAASNRAVMEEIRAAYEDEFGREVQIQYGPSQTLLSSLEVSGSGDLYLPADDSFLDMARDKQLVREVLPVAGMQGVIAVRKGNPKSIKSFDDLLRDDVRVVQANPDAAAIGKVTRRILQEAGLWDQLDAATSAYRTTVTDVANDLLVDAADAGIVYDAVLHTYPGLEFVEIDELKPSAAQVSIGVMAQSKQPGAALHFARYVAARDRGQKFYRQHGFRVTPGDAWSDVPQISIFAGSMLFPAIEDTIDEFARREQVEMSRVYNGCGILVAQMQAGQKPDAYFACDQEFMNKVTDLFPEPIDISQNQLVILVPKGNPRNIATLRDLGQPGLRVGIGHEKQCAMGWLTQNTLRDGGVQKQVMANVTMESPTGDTLVNQMRTGSLDAAVVYLSNATGAGEFLDAVQIDGIPCSVATQPFAIRPDSPNRLLLLRLLDQIRSVESREIFEAEGFQWKLNTAGADEHVE